MKVGMEIADQYEQYLLAVFESCDDFYQGSLSAAGLQQLCEKLQLNDSCVKLTKYLLGEYKSKRVYFDEFKEGLLKLLDGMECDSRTDGELSPAKEVPPKFVAGKKKYGRRSRQENNDNEESSSDSLCDRQKSQMHSCSTDDSSSEEAVPKKRRTRGCKRKEQKSLISKSVKNKMATEAQQTSQTTSTNEVEQLVTAWSSISRGVTDSLNSEELVKVFQRVGLERGSEEAAECIFEKLGVEENGRITLQELLEFIRSGGSWSKESLNQPMELEPTNQKNVSLDFIEQPSSTLGCVTGAGLVEQWECAGVPGASQLLQNLGFSPSQQIDLSSLVSLLSDEIKGLNEEMKSTRRSNDPQLALLRANSVLQTLYTQNLKTTIEHVNAENEKLRSDVIEANQRALLLAQEVDDHHSKLEHSTQQQVKSLKQKHAEKVRELTNQAKSEQDALLAQNVALERKLKQLEAEEAKSRSLISHLELESRLLEQENRTVVDQLSSVQSTKEKLEKDLENVSALRQRVSEMESTMNETDVVSLLERIQTLEKENTDLRDRNDELSVEVEDLSTKLLNTSIKKRSNASNSSPMEHSMEESIGGGGIKRRGDSFVLIESAEDSGGEEGSPRLGKVRKCAHGKNFDEAAPTALQELEIRGRNGSDCNNEEDSSPKENSARLTDREDIVQRKEFDSLKIVPFSEELEQADAGIALKSESISNQGNGKREIFVRVMEKLESQDKKLAEEFMDCFENLSKEIKIDGNEEEDGANEGLRNRCRELETSLELLRMEYEKTEDYWSEKLEEERSYFEEEQKMSDKKYSELVDKILEYEEMLNSEKGQRQRLETIEERDSFEKQVADMEEECEELKRKLAETVRVKEAEIEGLKREITDLKMSRDLIDSGVQVSDVSNLDPNEASCQNLNPEKSTSRRWFHPSFSQGNQSNCRNCAEAKNLFETRLKYQREVKSMQEERERLIKEISDKKEMLNNCGNNGGGENGKLRNHHLEQKCQTLIITLKQLQKQTEDILKSTWKQHKAEVNDLKSVLKMTEEKLRRQTRVIQEQLKKLSKTDLLVKDLFVENAYLLSSVQKLKEQCQSSSNSWDGKT